MVLLKGFQPNLFHILAPRTNKYRNKKLTHFPLKFDVKINFRRPLFGQNHF